MRIAWCLILAAGCTTIDDGFVVEVDARDAAVVVVKDGDGPWQRLATTPDGHAFVQIHEATYGVGALCGDATWKSSSFIFDTQPQSVFLSCPITISSSAFLHVTGTTAPLATVWLDGRSVRADETGTFDLQLFQPGLHDLFAIVPATPPTIIARRAIAISSDTVVDLAPTDAVEMSELFPTVLGAPADVELSSDLNTATDWISLGSSATTVFVPPPSFLLESDRPAIAARSGGTQPPSSSCVRQHPLSAANTPFELPAPIRYTLDRTQFAWTADPAVAWDNARVDIETHPGGRYSAFASASWRAAAGSKIPIVDLAALPGWTDDLASLRPYEPASASFSLSRGAYDGDLTSCSVSAEIDHW
jgi:hypothetical protein